MPAISFERIKNTSYECRQVLRGLVYAGGLVSKLPLGKEGSGRRGVVIFTLCHHHQKKWYAGRRGVMSLEGPKSTELIIRHRNVGGQ